MRSTKPAPISYGRKCTTNTHVNQMPKKLAFLKYFICTDMNNQMISNNPHISVNDNTSYEKPATCHAVMSTVPYNYTYEDILASTRT